MPAQCHLLCGSYPDLSRLHLAKLESQHRLDVGKPFFSSLIGPKIELSDLAGEGRITALVQWQNLT